MKPRWAIWFLVASAACVSPLADTPLSLAGGKPRLEKQKKIFYVPRNVSLIRVVRLKFHPQQTHFLLGQVTDRRLAVWNINDPIPKKATKTNRNKHIPPTRHCEHEVGWIRGFDIHPAGKWIATGGSDRRLKLWQWSGGKVATKPAAEIKAHDGWIEAVAFSPDGKRIATAGSDRVVKIWQATDLKLLHSFTGHTGFVRDVAWLPDGRVLVSTGEDGKVIAWNAENRQRAWEADFGNTNNQEGQNPGFSGALRVAVCPEGKSVAAAGRNKLMVYNLRTGQPLATERTSYDVCFHPRLPLLFGGTDRSKLWQYQSGELQKAFGKRLPAPGKTVSELRRQGEGLAFSPDGQWLAATERESTVAIWKVKK